MKNLKINIPELTLKNLQMKTKVPPKKILIQYEIVSLNCMKAVVKGFKIMPDKGSVKFIKRLYKVAAYLRERANDNAAYKLTYKANPTLLH